jgi:D-glycero-alpha-D-manno-heptose 1-phosphate guanylyltransferase
VNDSKAQVDAIILAGGRGTRLQTVVRDVPKPLAPVAGRPFLDYQIALLAASAGVRRAVLATGYLSDKIEAHYADCPPPLPLDIVSEEELLGTGGAVANALRATESARVLVMNGDSLFRWSLDALVSALDHLGPAGGAALGVVHVEDLSRYGEVEVVDGRVAAFYEKRPQARPGLINAGVYLFDRSVLEALPQGRVISLEHEVFPPLAEQSRLAAAIHRSEFIDIGVPDSYALAPKIVPRLASGTLQSS